MSDWTKAKPLPSTEWEFIGAQVLATNSAVISFTGLDTTYHRFILHLYAWTKNGTSVVIYLNNDNTTAHYEVEAMQVSMSTGGAVATNAFRSVVSSFPTALTGAAAATGAVVWALIQKPTATANARISTKSVVRGSGLVQMAAACIDGEWLNNSNLINRIDIGGSFAASTRAMLAGAREA